MSRQSLRTEKSHEDAESDSELEGHDFTLKYKSVGLLQDWSDIDDIDIECGESARTPPTGMGPKKMRGKHDEVDSHGDVPGSDDEDGTPSPRTIARRRRQLVKAGLLLHPDDDASKSMLHQWFYFVPFQILCAEDISVAYMNNHKELFDVLLGHRHLFSSARRPDSGRLISRALELYSASVDAEAGRQHEGEWAPVFSSLLQDSLLGDALYRRLKGGFLSFDRTLFLRRPKGRVVLPRPKPDGIIAFRTSVLPEDEKLDFRPSPDRPYLFGILAYEAKSKTGRSFEALEQGIVSLAVLSEALVDLGIPDAKPLVFTTIGDKWTLEAGILRGSPRDARLAMLEVASGSCATLVGCLETVARFEDLKRRWLAPLVAQIYGAVRANFETSHLLEEAIESWLGDMGPIGHEADMTHGIDGRGSFEGLDKVDNFMSMTSTGKGGRIVGFRRSARLAHTAQSGPAAAKAVV